MNGVGDKGYGIIASLGYLGLGILSWARSKQIPLVWSSSTQFNWLKCFNRNNNFLLRKLHMYVMTTNGGLHKAQPNGTIMSKTINFPQLPQ